MCVSGSLISSSTWRSSSVSAPSITSSIFLSRSRARSRTRRGSLFQALPIGCMRVFITPSCRSEVMCDRRCSGTAKPLSLLRARELQQLVAGQHQLAHQRHQVFQHVDGDADGLVAGHAARPAAALDGAGTGAAAAGRSPTAAGRRRRSPAPARRRLGRRGSGRRGSGASPAARGVQRRDQLARRRPPARFRWRPGRPRSALIRSSAASTRVTMSGVDGQHAVAHACPARSRRHAPRAPAAAGRGSRRCP